MEDRGGSRRFLMFEGQVPVTGVRRLARDMVVIALEAPEIAGSARAGQFVNLGLDPGPLLRRPFSVYRVSADRIEIVLRPVGTGTELLAGLRPGSFVSCLGPLGHGFELQAGGGPVALLSGGLGVAPMPLAARDAARLGLPVTWVHGARTAADLCREWEGDQVLWATDDGSEGFSGSVVSALDEWPGQVLGCGPNGMLAAVARRWPHAQVAIETFMGCGTGVCLGCAVPLVAGGFDRACREGPVYRAAAIDWSALPGHLYYALEATS